MQNRATAAYLQLPANHSFDYRYLMDVLRSYRSPRAKVTKMLRQGEILRVRKGLYVRSPEYGGIVEPVEIANAMYGPSYVSLEYALSTHGLVPEQVYGITSVTTKRSRTYTTSLATYSFEHIPLRAYPVGVYLKQWTSVGVLMATPEKAICDKVALTPHLRTIKDIAEFVIDNQRIESDDLAKLSPELLAEIESAYGLESIRLLTRWITQTMGSRSR